MATPLLAFHRDLHVRFVHNLDKPLRHNRVLVIGAVEVEWQYMYWGACTLALLRALPVVGSAEQKSLVEFVLSCASEQGDAFGGNVRKKSCLDVPMRMWFCLVRLLMHCARSKGGPRREFALHTVGHTDPHVRHHPLHDVPLKRQLN